MDRRGALLLVAVCFALLGVWLLQGPLSEDPAPLQGGDVAPGDGPSAEMQETPDAASGPGLVGTARLRARDGALSGVGTQAKARAASADSTPPPTVPFKGVVNDRDGKPVAGARVTVVGGGRIAEIRANAKGEFEHSLVAGRYDLLVRGEGEAHVSEQALIDGTGQAAHEFILRAVGSIRVTVLRGEEPISGVSFYLLPKARSLGPLIATGATDAGGVLRFEGLPAGPYDLTGTLPDSASIHLPGIEVQSGEEHEMVVRVPETVRFSGTVRAAGTGSVVAGARVELEVRPAGGVGTLLTVVGTAADGTFDAQVPRGVVQRFLVRAKGFAPYPPATPEAVQAIRDALRELAAGKPVRRIIELETGSSLDARMQDGSGQALSSVLVQVQSAVRDRPAYYTESDGEGAFQITNLAVGEYEVLVLSSGFYPRLQSAMRFSVSTAGEQVEKTFTLRPRLRVTGRVADASDEDVGGARVWLLAEGLESFARGQGRVVDRYVSEHGVVLVIAVAETYTKADGSFVLTDVPEFHDLDFFVRAATSGQATPPLALAEPDEHARRRGIADVGSLVLAPTAGLHGTVLDLDTRRPLDGVEVRLEPVQRRSGRAAHAARTRENGTFRLRGLLPGTWRVVVKTKGYVAYKGEELHVEQGAKPVYVDLDPGLVFEGVVHDEQDRPLPGVLVTVEPVPVFSGAPHLTARTDRDGRFRISGVPRHTSSAIEAAREGYRPHAVHGLTASRANLQFTLKSLRRPRRTAVR